MNQFWNDEVPHSTITVLVRGFFLPHTRFLFSIRYSCPQIWLSIVAKALPSPRKYGSLAEENRIIVKLRPEVGAKEVVLYENIGILGDSLKKAFGCF